MRANYTMTPGGDPIRGEGQLITNAIWHWVIVPALVIAGVVIVVSLISLGRWSATTPTTRTSQNHINSKPQSQKIEIEVKGLSTAVSKPDNAVDRLTDVTGKISGPAATQPPPPNPTVPPPPPVQIEVSGSLAIRQQVTPTDICTAPKESLTPREREWRFWNCPE